MDINTSAAQIKGIFDSHCHYDDSAFDNDRDEILSELMSDSSQVQYLMHACTDLDSADFGIRTAEKYANFYTSVGIHPESLSNLPDNHDSYIEKLKSLCKNPKVKAIGEIGLDYHYEGYDKDAQLRLFEEQLALANELSLPVITHCRDASEDFLRLMQKHKPRGVVHCFSGSAETAQQLLKLGLYIGFTGVLTFKNAKKAKKAFAVVPAERLLFETDCPYMSPEPFRGKRCRSDLIAYIACEAEKLSGIPAQQLADITNENARRLFGID